MNPIVRELLKEIVITILTLGLNHIGKWGKNKRRRK